jgi:protein gp37
MPEEWFADIMPTLAQSPHIYLVLTKWPNRFAKFSQKYPLPVNVCPGTSITSNKTTFRCNELMKVVGGGFKWLSIEPLWEKLDMNGLEKVDWMIFGGESGGNAAPCDMYWIIDGLDYCLEFAIPAFMKQMGSNPQWKGKPVPWAFKDYHGGDPDEWPKGMRVRQFPSWYVNQYIL